MGMSESALQSAVTDLARRLGWLVYSIPDSRRATAKGYPDLTLVHSKTGRVLFREMKTDSGRITPEQHLWLRLLSLQGDAGVWRTQDLLSGSIKSVLQEERLVP